MVFAGSVFFSKLTFPSDQAIQIEYFNCFKALGNPILSDFEV